MPTATAQPAAVTLPAWVDAAALTDRQRDYLAAFLALYRPRPRYVPTLQQAGRAIGVTKVTAHELQQALLRKGILIKGRGYRDIELNTPARRDRTDAAMCREEASRLREMARRAAPLMREAVVLLGSIEVCDRKARQVRGEMRQLADEIGALLGGVRTHGRL